MRDFNEGKCMKDCSVAIDIFCSDMGCDLFTVRLMIMKSSISPLTICIHIKSYLVQFNTV